jgi:FMN-dependent NADH-azoreductase
VSTLAHIDSSPLYGRSVSRQLAGAFVAQWKSSPPDGTVIDRDLNAISILPVNAESVRAVYTPEEGAYPGAEADTFAIGLIAL